MLEYLDPYHLPWLGITPAEDARWRTKEHLDYDFEYDRSHDLVIVGDILCHVTNDPLHQLPRFTTILNSNACNVIGIGKARSTPEGVQLIPVLTDTGPYLVRYHRTYKCQILPHPGPPSVFYPA